jgi:ribosomal protein L11 methyltransferase
MKYFEIDFTLTPCSEDAQDVLSALAGEAGCESFEQTADGLKAYIQQSLYDEDTLRLALDAFPFPSSIKYKVREAEDRDWNEQWEQEGFEPIVVRGEKREVSGETAALTLIIHDGRHLPTTTPAASTTTPDVSPSGSLSIEIDAHLAFGTGTHETTRMICATLLAMDLKNQRVLDCGCGTGILGICALKLGAASCVAYDIDEWSTDNTRHNAVINHVDDRLTALCGDSTVLGGDSTVLGGSPAEVSAASPAGSTTTPAASPAGSTTTPAASPAGFSLVLANINRNILLQDMPRFVSVMAPRATLILSGFYESDCALLESKAQSLGLTLTATKTDGDWACMVFQR